MSKDTCAIIPAFNCSSTIGRVVEHTKAHISNVITIDDGSTDGTHEIAKNAGAIVLRLVENQGKGAALRKGFQFAMERGFEHAITLDGDGQHDPSDIPIFLDARDRYPDSIILGVRNMRDPNVPFTSTLGNRIVNFFVNLSARKDLPDTQCGFRLYPLKFIAILPLNARGYEFESEVILRASLKGIRFYTVPVSTIYPPKVERITHFHLLRDTWHISRIVLKSFFWEKG